MSEIKKIEWTHEIRAQQSSIDAVSSYTGFSRDQAGDVDLGDGAGQDDDLVAVAES